MGNNHIAKKSNPLVIGLMVAAIAICIALGVWLFIKKDSKQTNNNSTENKEMSSSLQEAAPSHLVRDDGSYSLIAVIDGAGANKQFISNLQVINVQRQALGEIRNKVSSMPKSASDNEKAALTKRGSEIEASLVKNMEFMTKSYGYSIEHNYLLIPLKANVIEKGKDDEGKPSEDETKGKLVKTIETKEAYEHFEALRGEFTAAATEDAEGDKAKEIAGKLKDEYSFDVKGDYILQITKGALYANVK